MKTLLRSLLRRAPSTTRRQSRRLSLEMLEDRLTPAGNLLVTVAGPYPQHLFREYTPSGALVRAVNIPPTPGSTFDYSRDLVQDAAGKVYVYNGTFTPYLATYNPTTTTWTQTTYAGWSTVSNVSYGGLALFQNYVYATDMATAGAMQNGVVRFNLSDNSVTRFGNVDFTDLNMGLDGKLYALAGQKIMVFDPISTQQLGTVLLPAADYRGIAVNANGEIFTAAWNNVISHFTPGGTLISSVTLNSSTGAPFMYGNPDDIDVAADGTVAVGSWSGHIVQMTSNFTNISYFDTGTNNTVFVTFATTSSPPLPTVSVNDVTVTEGNTGTTPAAFLVTLSAPSSQPVTVSFATANGTAMSGSDYQTASGTLTFAPGQTSQTIPVNIIGDTLYEANETFTFNLSNPVGATLGRAGTGTILNDDPMPSVTVGDASVVEGNSGMTSDVFVLSLSSPSGLPVTVNYSTADVTATANSDYFAASGTVTFAPGQTTQNVSVYAIGDTVYEPNETFTLNLSNATGATLSRSQATGTILNDDPLPSATVNDVTVTASTSSTTPAFFTVSLTNASSQAISLNYATADGTALAGTDYQAASGTLTFAPGQTSQSVLVTVLSEAASQPNKTFTFNLSNATGASLGRAQATGTIVTSAPPPTITVGDVSVTEGNSGTTLAAFTVSLSGASSQTVTVAYATANGTATAGSDYQAANGTLSFAPGQTSQTVIVSVFGDTVYEPNETFTLNLSNPTNATLARSQATGTIVNDDALPSLTVGDVSVSEGNSGTTAAVFTLTLSNASYQAITVNYATADGTAVGGSDYQTASGTVTFAAGQISQTVTVNVIGDTVYEPNETFTLNLSSITNATLARAQATGTILNDDPLPSVTVNDVSVLEGNTGTTPETFTLTLSNASYQTITVSYATAAGTATAGSDYQTASGTVTFAPGQTSQTVTVAVIGDTLAEANETYTLNLSSPTNATLARAQGTGTIIDDDTPPSITIGDVSVLEGNSGYTPATFTLSLSSPSGQSVSVSYYTSPGTATSGSDYVYTSGTVTFAPGQTTQTITVNVIGDTLKESNETYFLYLNSPTNATLARSQATGTIIDDDPNGTIEFTAVTGGDVEDYSGNGSYVLSQVNGSYVQVQVGGGSSPGVPDERGIFEFNTASFAGQQSQTSSVVLRLNEYSSFAAGSPVIRVYGYTGDGLVSVGDYNSPSVLLGSFDPTTATGWRTITLDRAALLSLVGSSGYVGIRLVGLPNDNVTFNSFQTGTPPALDFVPGTPPALPGLSVGDVSLLEGNPQVNGGGPPPSVANFTLSLSQSSSVPVTVSYQTLDGTAYAGSDYTSLSGFVVFNPGETQKTVGVTITPDTIIEPDETFQLLVKEAANASVVKGSGTGTILNDDYPVVSIGSASLAEGNSGISFMAFPITLSTSSNQAVTVNWATSDITGVAGGGNYATANVDYQTMSGMVYLSPGQSSTTVFVNIIGDRVVEPNEQFIVGLTSATNATLSSTPYAYGTILNDDYPAVSVADATVTEGNSGTTPATFTVSLDQPGLAPVTVNYTTADGTAKAGSDYQAVSGTLTFAAGQTSKTVAVNVIGNTLNEPDKTFKLNLSSVTGGTLARSQATGTILNDDPVPSLAVGDVSVAEGNSGTTPASFTVSLSAPSGQTVTVAYATTDGTATAGSDYQTISGTLTFAAGQTSQTVTVQVNGDRLVEADETFTVTLSNPTNATLGRAQATGTILNDDHAPVVNAGPNQTVNEAATVTFDASASTDPDGDPLTFTWDFGDGSTGTGAQPTHVFADNGVYTVSLTVSDGVNVSTGTLTVTVLNMPPTAAVSGPADSVPGQARTFTLSAADPSPVDQAAGFTFQINWGDGSTQTVQGPGSGVAVTHVFTTSGSPSVSVTATDKDGGTSVAASQAIGVVAAELQGGDLFVGGTLSDDTITLQPADASGTVDVVINGQDQGTFVPTGQIVVYSQSGNDVIQVLPLDTSSGLVTVDLPVVMFAGDGTDTLDARGVSGPTVLVGGGGNDTLFGGSGRNILIGGSGASVLNGGTGDNLQIAGVTSFDANLAALMALRAEWARSDADYQTRISDLTGSQSGGLNGNFLLTGQTVTSSGAGDVLNGGPGQDWYFARLGGANPDQINNLLGGEIVNSI